MKKNRYASRFPLFVALLVVQLAISSVFPVQARQASSGLAAKDLTVGPGCTYGTIGAAVAAANSGDRLLLAGGVTFKENVSLSKSLTLQGGYNKCTGQSSTPSIIDGQNSGTALAIAGGLTVALTNLSTVNGKGANGGGIQFAGNPTAGSLTMSNVAISNNTAASGGGLWAGSGVQVTGTNVSMLNNTADTGAGGAITASGVKSITLTNTTLQSNSAKTDGGAVFIDSGTLDFTGWWDISSNSAGGNGGAVAIDGTGANTYRATAGKDSSLSSNHAVGNGGALFSNNNNTIQLYAYSGFAINFWSNQAGGSGGAIYANDGAFFDVWGKISAMANLAGGDGGVWYLGNGSQLWMTSFLSDQPHILGNQAQNGGAIFASSSGRVECDDVIFGAPGNGNTATAGSGGAISATDSSLFASNCLFQYNAAASNGGAIAAAGSTLIVGVSFGSPAAAAHLRQGYAQALPAASAGCMPVFHECSSFSHNSAGGTAPGTGLGGAIYTTDTFSLVDLTYLHENSAANGSAMYAVRNSTQVTNTVAHHNIATGASGASLYAESGTFTLQQVTLAYNTGAGFGGAPAASTTASNTISWGNSAAGYAGIGAVTCSIGTGGGPGGLNQDPKFLGNGDYRPWLNSPAIDACASGLSIDINDYARPYNDLYDMGAYEWVYTLSFMPAIRK